MTKKNRNEKRKMEVMEYLFARRGQWVPRHEITTIEVDGSQGDRRFRAARSQGWPVECRPSKKGTGDWEYRMKPK